MIRIMAKWSWVTSREQLWGREEGGTVTATLGGDVPPTSKLLCPKWNLWFSSLTPSAPAALSPVASGNPEHRPQAAARHLDSSSVPSHPESHPWQVEPAVPQVYPEPPSVSTIRTPRRARDEGLARLGEGPLATPDDPLRGSVIRTPTGTHEDQAVRFLAGTKRYLLTHARKFVFLLLQSDI